MEEQTPIALIKSYRDKNIIPNRDGLLNGDVEMLMEQYAQYRERKAVLQALQNARLNIEKSDQYYLNEVKRYDYTKGFNKANILIVQQINELQQK